MKAQISWYTSRLRRMSRGEIYWRCRQITKAKIDGIFARQSRLPEKAAAVRKTLELPKSPLYIEYFDKSFEWQFDDLPWQGPGEQQNLAEKHWSSINYRDAARYGDPKQTWELNRHQFVRNWVINNLPRKHVAANFEQMITQWIEQNPYGYGMNWTSSLELALRLMSWQSAVQALGKENLNPRVIDIIHDSTVEHARHIAAYPSLYSSANNHRIGELVGEMAAAVIFPKDQILRKRATHAWNNLQTEAKLQVSDDGVSREQAVYYHAYVLLFLRRAASYGKLLSFIVPSWFYDLVNSMQEFLDATTDAKNEWFEIGDRDDGNLLALTDWTMPAEILPDAHEAQQYSNQFSNEGHRNKCVASTVRSPALSSTCPKGFHAFPEGGYAIWKRKDFHLLFRAGNFGYPAIAAHAHCDQMAVLLKINNKDFLTDSGTYCYHDEERWRRYFKGSAAHNVVRIDQCDQAEYGGPFLWKTNPAATIKNMNPDGATGEVTIAYPSGTVTHTRELSLSPDDSSFLIVTDTVKPTDLSSTHIYELIWNLAPGLTVRPTSPQASDDIYKLAILTAGEEDQADFSHIEITINSKSHLAIYHGDSTVPAGFYSRRFGHKLPITQVRVVSTTPEFQAETRFSIPVIP